jgi:hypothetical protein
VWKCEEPICPRQIRLGSTGQRKANAAAARPCRPPSWSKDNIESGGNEFATARPYANPEAAARKLIEIANSVEAVQDGRIYIELINGPMLFEHNAGRIQSGA